MGEDLQSASQATARRPDIGRGAWFLPVLVATLTGLVMVLLAGAVKVPGDGLAAPTMSGEVPELIVTRLDRLPLGGEVREHLRLWDPARLFLPSRVVTDPASAAEGIVDRPGGNVTEPFPAALIFRDIGPSREILRPAPPKTPLAAMDAAVAPRWFAGMARADERADESVPAAMAADGKSTMDVYPVGVAKRIATIALPNDPTLEGAVWQPIELSVLINAAGAAASPVIIIGSGRGEVDAHVRMLATRELLPRLRLRPGAYRLVVGP